MIPDLDTLERRVAAMRDLPWPIPAVPLAPKEIAERIDKPDGNVRKLLHGMRDDGQVVQHGSHPRYRYTPLGNGNDGNDGNDGNESNDGNVTNVTGTSKSGNDKNGENAAYLRGLGDNVTVVTARRITAEEGNERVQQLIDEGMRPDLAVHEVLGDAS